MLHHLLAQFCRKPVCLLLPLGRLLDRFIRLRVNALQPPPERLVDRKIELRAGGFGTGVVLVPCRKGQVLCLTTLARCCLLSVVLLFVNTDQPCTAQFILQFKIHRKRIRVTIFHGGTLRSVFHPNCTNL